MTDQGSPEHGILDSLPAARPQRRSAKRDAAQKPRAAARKQPPRAAAAAKKADPPPPRPRAQPAPERPRGTTVDPPSNSEILSSAAGAVGELAQLGLKLTEQLLRAATQRIPKP